MLDQGHKKLMLDKVLKTGMVLENCTAVRYTQKTVKEIYESREQELF